MKDGRCEKVIGVWEAEKSQNDLGTSAFFHDYCLEYKNLNYRKIQEFFIVFKLKNGTTRSEFDDMMANNSKGLFGKWTQEFTEMGTSSQIAMVESKVPRKRRSNILYADFKILTYLK